MAAATPGIHLRRGVSGCHPLPCPQRRTIVKKAMYIAIGVDLDGKKDVLGMWVGKNESAKFWATVLNGPKTGASRIFSSLAPTI